tara:strand:+ start:1811 stop:2641 length:831 start_codon:yes stop_codon:yes gene_type:complete
MKHINEEIISSIIERSLNDNLIQKYKNHINKCDNCFIMYSSIKSGYNEMNNTQLEQPSNSLYEKVNKEIKIEEIDKTFKLIDYFIPNNENFSQFASMAATAACLVFIIYSAFSTTTLSSSKQSEEIYNNIAEIEQISEEGLAPPKIFSESYQFAQRAKTEKWNMDKRMERVSDLATPVDYPSTRGVKPLSNNRIQILDMNIKKIFKYCSKCDLKSIELEITEHLEKLGIKNYVFIGSERFISHINIPDIRYKLSPESGSEFNIESDTLKIEFIILP